MQSQLKKSIKNKKSAKAGFRKNKMLFLSEYMEESCARLEELLIQVLQKLYQNSPSAFDIRESSFFTSSLTEFHSSELSDHGPFHSFSLPHGFRTRTRL